MLSNIQGILIGLGATGVATGVAMIDNRRQRTQREKAVQAAHATIERLYGLLIGIKPAVVTLPDVERAINDGLSAINQERQKLADL